VVRSSYVRLLALTALAVIAGSCGSLVEAGFVNFESPQTHPIALGQAGTLLFVVNTPDNRLAVLNATTGALIAEVPVGLEPVSLAPHPTANEVWVVNHLSDSVDVVDTLTWSVIRTISVGDEPAAIAFTPDGSKGYVTISQRNELAVIDTATYAITANISLDSPPSFNSQDPRALAVDQTGSFVYVAPFESGNQTRGDGPPFSDPNNPVGQIVFDGSLSDDDLFVIRVSDNAIVNRIPGLGTILTNVRISPDNSKIYITGWDARNLVLMIENLQGRVNVNQLTVLDRTTLAVLNQVDLDGPQPTSRARAVAQPSDIAFDNTGRLWITAQGNNEVVVTDSSGNFIKRLPAGSVPRALAFNSSTEILYVFNRLSHDITAIDTNADIVLETISIGYDPTPPIVSLGRPFLYTAEQSGDGTQSCASCHLDGHTDNVVWDVGQIADPKGPMFTQSFRGLAGNAPFHWRGEKPDLLAFNIAFVELFAGSQLSATDNQSFADYMATIDYPPNPNRNRDGSLSAALAQCGEKLFLGLPPTGCPPPMPAENRQNFQCVACHALPHGTNNLIIPAAALGTHADMEVSQLRGAYDKVGFVHDGREKTIHGFLSASPPFPVFPEIDKLAMEAFVMEFPGDHHSAVGIERTANQEVCPGGILDSEIAGTLAFLEVEAAAGVLELAVAGTLAPHGEVHFLFDSLAGTYDFDDTTIPAVNLTTLTAAACAGTANLTFTAWPLGTGVRSLDRDEDTLLNRDELALGTNPADKDSDDDALDDGEEIAAGTNPTDPDSDADGAEDGEEVSDGTNPLDPASFLRFLSVEILPGGDVELTWTTVFNRRYTIGIFDDDLILNAGDPFVDAFTTPVPEIESPEGTEIFVDINPPILPGFARFYRAVTLPPGS
jgi:YVTN family beta-propeller protein